MGLGNAQAGAGRKLLIFKEIYFLSFCDGVSGFGFRAAGAWLRWLGGSAWGESGDPSLAFRVPLAVGGGAGRAGWDGEEAERALGAPRAGGLGGVAEAGFEKPVETGWRTRWRRGTGRKTTGLNKTEAA